MKAWKKLRRYFELRLLLIIALGCFFGQKRGDLQEAGFDMLGVVELIHFSISPAKSATVISVQVLSKTYDFRFLYFLVI